MSTNAAILKTEIRVYALVRNSYIYHVLLIALVKVADKLHKSSDIVFVQQVTR